MHHQSADLLIDAATSKRNERNVSSATVTEFAQHIDRPGIRHPGGASERAQRLTIDLDGELACFFVGHAANSEPGTEFAERVGKVPQVVGPTFRYTIDVTRWSKCTVSTGAEAADEDVVDVVAVEDGEDLARVER